MLDVSRSRFKVMDTTFFSSFCSGDIQGERKIRISKNGTLNIYIAVDVSESIEAEYVKNATDAVKKLITKVRNIQR